MKHFLTLLCAAAMMPLNLWAQTDPCQNFAANFTFDPPGTNLSVAFINQSDGDYTNIVWTFGDGSTSTDLQPTHTYAAVGMYQICLTISNDWCESSTCKTVLITPLVEPTCEAFFAYQTNGLTATLNGNESGGSGEIIGWQWWLNGTMIGNESTLTYTFPEAGEYSVCLAINTADGCTDEYCHEVVVEAEPQPCEAFFNIETDGLTIWLNGNPSVPNDLSGFTWNFGDGTANDDNFEVTHTYEQAGTYTVCLLIWNNNTDCEDDYCQTITLNETTTPTCEAFFAYQTNGLTATLNGNESGGSGEIIGWQWWLNGTMIGDGSILTYTFPEAGEYSVCLAINTADGCTDEYCHGVAVEAEPQPCEAFFSIETNGLTIWLNGNPSVPNDLSGFTWNFGDGTANDNNFELTHTYEQAGTYTVCLLIWNNNTDCEDDYCQTITLNETTTPTCEAFFAYQTNGLTATLNGNESGGSGEIIGWQWWLNGTMIGDGSTLTYTFPEAGEYSVCLAINTADGCTDEYCHGGSGRG
jgi:PKD repeat protein